MQKMVKLLDILKEYATAGSISCSNCDWKWDKASGGKKPYLCHKCGMENTPSTTLEEKSVHEPSSPGILKRRLGTLSCSKVKAEKAKLTDKGTHFAKALQRYLNYHC